MYSQWDSEIAFEVDFDSTKMQSSAEVFSLKTLKLMRLEFIGSLGIYLIDVFFSNTIFGD